MILVKHSFKNNKIYDMKENFVDWDELVAVAINVRENAFIFGKTKVGCALLTDTGKVLAGCNVEHVYRSHDIHAEVNAISSMVAVGEKRIIAIVVVAERDNFTPCGSCMDWIIQFGEKNCLVGFQNILNGNRKIFKASDLMPYYPY